MRAGKNGGKSGRMRAFILSILAPLYVTVLPLVLLHKFLWNIWTWGIPRAWDGTGHFGIAQIYARNIFPDTFGWTQMHFGGMPFPNFYPPLFFWCVSLLYHSRLFTFVSAFKLMVLLPILLIPAAMWTLAWFVSEGDRRIAFWTSMLCLIPLVDYRFGDQLRWASGLEYSSTFGVGLYTQPLGFVLLIAWYVTYLHADRRAWRFALAALLLALAVLGNYLNGITTALIIGATLLTDLRKFGIAAILRGGNSEARRVLLAHAITPIIAFALALFWLVPMMTQYTYFVTRPFTLVIITPLMMIWFVLAIYGFFCWARRPTPALWPYLITCFVLVNVIIFAAAVAPPWFPLQANRLLPTASYLITVPVGFAVANLLGWIRAKLGQRLPRVRSARARLGTHTPTIVFASFFFLLVLAASFSYPITNLYTVIETTFAVYPANLDAQPVSAPATSVPDDIRQPPVPFTPDELLKQIAREHQDDYAVVTRAGQTLNAILRFGREHPQGRYLVENPNLFDRRTAFLDGHALNSYLGAQGNQTLSVIFREVTPNSVFFNPLANVFSFNPDTFGFSSALSDDLDFTEQPLARHIELARQMGTRYLVIYSPAMKERLAQEPGIGARQDIGDWSIFELNGEMVPPVQALVNRPALVVSPFTVKGRHANDYNFIRLAEEQFADGWFDVLLVRAPSIELDDLLKNDNLSNYGAIVLDTYECDNCDQVFRHLRYFAQNRPLILLMRDTRFFQRLRDNIADFPNAVIIERQPESRGPFLDNWGPSRRYGSSEIRKVWGSIRSVLESHKVPVAPVNVTADLGQNSVRLNLDGPVTESVPVLIRTSYHPSWQRRDGQRIYAANPMFMLTFVRESTSLVYARRWFDWLALVFSALTLAGLALFTALSYYRRAPVRMRHKAVKSPPETSLT